MSYVICRFCDKRHLSQFTTSWDVGCCQICRKEFLPNYIPEEQWKQFLDKLHRKTYDTKKRPAKRNTKIFQI
jgi:hypothetical protein